MRPVVFTLFIISLISTSWAISPVEQVDAYLNKAAKHKYSGSVLLAVNGKVLLKKGYGFADPEKQIPFEADTVFDIGSVTKQFTAAAILRLETQKKLSVTDPITKYFRNVPEDKKAITIHHLLTHTAGLPGALGEDEEYIDRESYVKKAMQSPLTHPPSKYDYSNVGYSLLAVIVETVSGKEYEQFLIENFFQPLNMRSTGYVLPRWKPEKIAVGYRNGKRWGTTIEKSQYKEKGVTWHLKGNGGIFSTVEDMYVWCEALGDKKVFAPEVTEKLFQAHVPEDASGSSYYGYGWSIMENSRKEKVISHNGGNTFYMDTVGMIPAQDAVIIVSSTHAPKNTDVIAERIDRLLFENIKPLEESWLAQYRGMYVLPSGTKFKIDFNENDSAVAYLNNSESYLLLSSSPSENAEKIKETNRTTESLLQSPTQVEQLQKELGKLEKFEVLGSVSRRSGEYYLTPVRLYTEKGEFYRLFIWHNDELFNIRELPDGNTMEFQHQSGEEFFAETNGLKIRFTTSDKKPVMVIHSKSGEVIAHRTEN
jgi:CubicO group peptidase (beta-lactamase class C family)